METPAVSIIVPAYRVTKYIADALDSIFRQTFTDYEVIVVNDGCPDTAALEQALTPYRVRIRYIQQENRGLACARNTGIRNSAAPLVVLLDADDILEPNYLEKMVAAMRADVSLDVLYCDALFFGEPKTGGRRFTEFCPSEGPATFLTLLTQRCNVLVTATIRRERGERVGWFDESLRSAEDFDLWLRIAKAGGRIEYLPDPLVRIRKHAGSLSSDPVWMWGVGLKVLRKTAERPDLTPEEARELSRVTEKFQANLDFQEGRRAFFAGDTSTAVSKFESANRVLQHRKLAAILATLKIAPRVAMPLLRALGQRLGRGVQ